MNYPMVRSLGSIVKGNGVRAMDYGPSTINSEGFQKVSRIQNVHVFVRVHTKQMVIARNNAVGQAIDGQGQQFIVGGIHTIGYFSKWN